jgi:hypothetical protein
MTRTCVSVSDCILRAWSEKESDAALSGLIAKYHASMAYSIAEVYAFRNQSDEAFEWLDRAYAQRDSGLIVTKVEPLLKSLHKDPRFLALLKKLNLPQTLNKPKSNVAGDGAPKFPAKP